MRPLVCCLSLLFFIFDFFLMFLYFHIYMYICFVSSMTDNKMYLFVDHVPIWLARMSPLQQRGDPMRGAQDGEDEDILTNLEEDLMRLILWIPTTHLDDLPLCVQRHTASVS